MAWSSSAAGIRKTGNLGVEPGSCLGAGDGAGGAAGMPESVGIIVIGADWESVNASRQAKRVKCRGFIFFGMGSLKV